MPPGANRSRGHSGRVGIVKLSAGVEWSLHCCVVLSHATAPVAAGVLAEFHGVSKTYLAKQLQSLAGAGLIRATEGRAGGYSLTRAADSITVLDVVRAVDGAEPRFRCTEIRQQGTLGLPPEECRTPCGVAKVMADADRAWRSSLSGVTVADLATTFDTSGLSALLAASRERPAS